MRAFVTGLDGFVGQWLARELLAAGDDVSGGSRTAKPSYSILNADEARRLRWFGFELRGGVGISEALTVSRPHVVYHLAAQASVGVGFDDPIATIEANVLGSAHVFERCQELVPEATVLYVGSAEAYGPVKPDELPLRESAPLRPSNPYSASKAAAEIIALQQARTGPLKVIATRSFNHTGPGQRTAFAAPAFARQIADIARGRQPPVMHVGNLAARRDFSDVRDVVRAYRLLVERGTSGAAYNVCSGRSVSMREIVDTLVAIAGVDIEVQVDPARLRPVDTPDIVGDNTLLRQETGWEPRIPLRTTLEDLLTWQLNTEP